MTVVGTWNVENLFRPGGEFGPDDERIYQEKIRGLAETITQAEADVVAVEEVGDPAALDDVRAQLGDDWRAVTSRIFDSGHPIRVGFLSRLSLEIIIDTAEFPDLVRPVQTGDNGDTVHQMGRGALAARVRDDTGQELVIVACHLKSKLLSFPPDRAGKTRFTPHDEGERARVADYALSRRAAEAATVRALADTLLAGQGKTRQVIVAGDLNDEPGAATTQILLGPPGSELGTEGEKHPDKGDASRLWNLAPHLPEGEQYSRDYRGRHELIDHLMVSHALLNRANEVHTLHSADRLPSVTDNPVARRKDPVTDHALLYTRLS
jgi:endonuclease/exonuclease/phosphatase family metal-dependent hydrolase